MRKVVFISLLLSLFLTASGQKPAPVKKPSPAKTSLTKPAPTPAKSKDSAIEKADFETAAAVSDPTQKIKALQKFISDYPKSANKTRALELILTARAVLADEKLQAGDPEAGIALFKLAIKEGPEPMPDDLFERVIANFPANIFWQGQREGAIEIAQMIEAKAGTNTKQILAMASFYLGIEYATEARRVAEKVIQLEPGFKSAYQTLGLAYRMSFQPEESGQAYAKALELDGTSVVSRRSLAEAKRALGKSDEAAALYREILTSDESDGAARAGLVLSLFDAGKQAEAEKEMEKALDKEADNLPLLSGAAYWYAAHDNGVKAIDLAQAAIGIEPRYIWSHIALARGYMVQKRPLDAERVLLSARQYGNFPTLYYEIASARMMAGFYREAVEELRKSFALKDGLIETHLGGRIPKESKSFTELISYERRASIFEPVAADSPENAAALKALLDLTQKLEAAEPNEADVSAAADDFIGGDDNMKFHRQIYASNALLQKKAALPKVLDIMKSATGNTDRALDVANASSAVLADQLYESRARAMSRNELVVVPDVPRQTLLSVLRGKIEDTTGAALLQQGNAAEAIIRFRRAISVLPEKSAWWRASLWRLGSALAADGKDKEGLDSYIKSYVIDRPDGARYATIEALYRKVYGNADGLEAKIGVNPAPPLPPPPPPVAEKDKQAETAVPKTELPVPKAEAAPEVKPAEITEKDKTAADPAAQKPAPSADGEPKPESTPGATPAAAPDPIPLTIKEDVPAKTESLPEPLPASTPAAEPAVNDPKPGPEKPLGVKPEGDPAKSAESAKAPEVKEDVPVEKAPDPKTGPDPAKRKELFEPIIITIPSAGNKTDKSAEKPKQTEPPAKETDNSGAARARVVVEKSDKDEPPKCSLTLSQENVSLLNDGGSIGILVGIEGDGDVKDLTATSSNPRDVTVVLDPGIGGPRRAFYVIKSVSVMTGSYTIMFESPSCGKREIAVKVK
jgi:tetratricopeptide (TPR) repeat protein